MDAIKILRRLWHHRLPVACVALASITIGFLLAYHATFPPQSRTYKVGIATVRILVDTPKSQVVEIAPKGSETLGSRANVLANLMVDGEAKDAIARRAGIKASKLFVATLPAPGEEPARPPNPRGPILTAGVVTTSDSAELPIIKLEAQASDARHALILATAAVSGLSDYLNSKAADEQVTAERRLRVSGLGVAQAHEVVRGPGHTMALVGTIFVFLFGCTVILLGGALVRGWREAAILEQREFADPSEEEELAAFFEENGERASRARPEFEHSAGQR